MTAQLGNYCYNGSSCVRFVMLGSDFGRTDFSRILFLGHRIFSRILSPDFFSSFCGEKCPEKSSRKIPGKILQNLYNENPRHISAEGLGQVMISGVASSKESRSCVPNRWRSCSREAVAALGITSLDLACWKVLAERDLCIVLLQANLTMRQVDWGFIR